MARTSSAGLPHLTCRSDAGQFTYHRSFRPDLVPFLQGFLRPSWSPRTLALDGRRVVKVSLGTGDRRLAVTRWEELHPVVQKAVREAERAFRQGLYRDALIGRRLDLAITEGEVVLPGDVAERLRRDPSSLTDADRLATARAPLIAPRIISSELDALLAANGLELPLGHPSRGTLALAVARAQVQAARIEQARETGRPEIDTPPMPPPVRPAPTAGTPAGPDPERCLSALIERWKRDKRPGTKQADDKARYVRLFISHYGDLPAEQVTPLMVSQFRDTLLTVARNASAVMRDASLDDLVAWSAKPENVGRKCLSRPTINAKALGALSVLMKAAKKLGFIQINPCSEQALEIRPGDAKKRKAYSLADLKRIFMYGVFAPVPKLTKGGSGPAALWLPLLALFTGARLEELGQLLIEDIRNEDGIDYLIVTDLPDEDGPAEVGGHKSVKTVAGRRRIPIHSELKRLGFLTFVARRRAAGYVRLFPELEYYRDRCTKNWSRYWARLTDRHVTDRDDKAFHSFRHTFTRMLRHAKVAETTIKALVGHADDGDVTSGYGGDDEGFLLNLEVLRDVIETISFPELDLSRVIGLSEKFGW